MLSCGITVSFKMSCSNIDIMNADAKELTYLYMSLQLAKEMLLVCTLLLPDQSPIGSHHSCIVDQ